MKIQPTTQSLTESTILAALPMFERVTSRRAVRAILSAMDRGLSLVGAAREALARLAADRRRARDADAGAARDALLRLVARHEAEARCALQAASALSGRVARWGEAVADVASDMLIDPSWRLVQVALRVLGAEARAGRPIPSSVEGRVADLTRTFDAPVWSQVAAWRFLLEVTTSPDAWIRGAELTEALAGRLATRAGGRAAADDCFVRGAVADLLASCPREPAVSALTLGADDPSEHVRMSCARALGAHGAAAPLAGFADCRVERSPRVRAVALAALGAIEPAALARALRDDPDELPCRVAIEEGERLVEMSPDVVAAIEEMAASSRPVLAAFAADAAERIRHRASPEARRVLESLVPTVSSLPPGASTIVEVDASEEQMGRALAVIARDDHSLAAEPLGAGEWRLIRGERRRRRLWRLLHEMRNPSPDKRQSHSHATGRTPRGDVRAPTGVLAEVSATRVPGERVFVPASAGWGRHLPTVDDLLERPARGEASIFSSFGVTRVVYPARRRWPASRAGIVAEYAALARLRQRALETVDSAERHAYARALERHGFSLRFSPHGSAAEELVELFAGRGTSSEMSAHPPGLGAFVAVPGLIDGLTHTLSTRLSGAHSANQVAAVGLVAVGLMASRLHEARREIDRTRASIPLSIGGWGTRGKSGTERLKAALFQALGCEVFAKTTGCEAMFLHAIPGRRAEEIFLYRTYDKATIWEQRDALRLAAGLGVDVFLWECMALSPAYVDILERKWMRDNFCTITNAYPDHENVQGPSGLDVAQVISEFVPEGKTVVTAEEQMLPILRDAAVARGTRLCSVGWREVELLPEDVLARFPYQEHPRNVALVVKLAAELGVPADIALKEMADWIVPDLGVLKTYPTASWRERQLEFANGMSANERAGFLGNWSRLGFDAGNSDAPGTRIVTVINNRGDRNARSAVFADIVARDVAAHLHVIIGSNVRGFAALAEKSWRAAVAETSLFDPSEDGLGADVRVERALARARRVLARVGLGEVGPRRLAAEANALARGLGVASDLVDETTFSIVEPERSGPRVGEWTEAFRSLAPRLERALAPFGVALGAHGPEAVASLVDLAVRHALVLDWVAEVRAGGPTDRAGHEHRFGRLAAELFRASLLVLDDPHLTGDQVVDAVARAVPPGSHARVMGAQNIKGTGLDFAYRWVSFGRTCFDLANLEGASSDDQLALARALLAREELGVLDLSAIEGAFNRLAAGAPAVSTAGWAELVAAAAERRRVAVSALTGRAQRSAVVAAVERVLDVWDGVARKVRAGRLLDDLVAGRRSQSDVARAMRELVARQKGGWLGAGR
jgi:poly-gamma-glutamate synthase PgsB/CapB